MSIRQFAAAASLSIAALSLSACAESISTTVSRYQAMPAPQGQTFFVVPDSPMAANGGLEFQRYAGIVAQQLQGHGYAPATGPADATMIVQFGYGMDKGTVRYQDYGFYPYAGLSGYWGSPFHHPAYGWGGSYLWGWNDPFWYGGGIDSYIEYHSQIELHIRQAKTNAPLFDGRAQARSYTDRLDVVVPSLLDAMFMGFPGQNGETLKITIPPRQNGQPAPRY